MVAIQRAISVGGLLEESDLAVHGKDTKVERVRCFGEELSIDAVAAEPLVQTDRHGLRGEIGGEALGAGARYALTYRPYQDR